MNKLSVPTCPAGAWRNLATNTAVKPVRKQAPEKLRLRVNATMEFAHLPSEEQ